ncbi:ECF RNA polymerase sigma factor SigG [Actinomadura sp. RB99]|uniref:sigma-70 family RNA polymerase sigma factor n=1 Tax=Actinomadura sp. RB99 TaxID=2691577 RepID=UPI0016870825|nr:sigma-70 family RNA polymerase sigma factor [Actinomadura sp. RB99]MBD2899371.1 ECF RNA polymerase sigma factor SigG [Actinomadura sp. RB99]
MADDGEFARLTDPYRSELLVHCYRMLGSLDEAEDLVQEVYLRAWRSFDRFEGRASLRTWLHRIATNVCLTGLGARRRRPLPSGLGAPGSDPEGPVGPARTEVEWLQPLPGRWADAADGGDPAAVVASRAGVRLALIAALQHLPARQRAVLILRDVLGWRAAEVAETLGTSTIAVKSMLQRAREQIERLAPEEDGVAEPDDPGVRALLDRYAAAFENADAAALADLLTRDATLEMPPFAAWFAGRDHVARFAAAHILGAPGDLRLFPVSANGRPAAASYMRSPDGVHRAHCVQVLTVADGRVAGIVAFLDPGLFPRFGLPAELPYEPPSAAVPGGPVPSGSAAVCTR